MRLFAVLAAAGVLAAPSFPAVAAYQHDEAAIVRVECKLPSGERMGTAVKIGPATYITAAHVVDGGECTANGIPITVTFIDEESDFATFTGPWSASLIPVGCDGFKPGQVYVARGYAGGGFYNVLVPWLATELRDGPKTMFVGEAIPGMSGGPLIDRAGRVVGIVNQHTASRSLPLGATKLCNKDNP